MTSTAPAPAEAISGPPTFARRFEAIVFDWDAAAGLDRRADARRIQELVEQCSVCGLDLALVSGAGVAAVDGRLAARPAGPGGLILALHRGSEVFSVDRDGPRLMFRRTATPLEEAALSCAAQLMLERLAARGVTARIVAGPLNGRRIDLIPDPGWDEPIRDRIDELLVAVEGRLHAAGVAGLAEVIEIARDAAGEAGLEDPRVTSDAGSIEIGLADGSDSAGWIMRWLWERGVAPGQVLVVGGEFLGGLSRSDSLLFTELGDRSTLVSVAAAPCELPVGVVSVGGGAAGLTGVLEDQIARRREGELPIVPDEEAWALVADGIPALERVRESLLTLADGRIGTRGSVIVDHASGDPAVLVSGVYAGQGSETHLLAAPRWNAVGLEEGATPPIRRVLDLHAGVLHQQIGTEKSSLSALLFSSLARPGTAVLRALGPIGGGAASPSLQPPADGQCDHGEEDGLAWMRVGGKAASIAAAASDRQRGRAGHRVLDRVAAYEASASGAADQKAVLDRTRRAAEAGFDALLAEHRRAWASRWEDADVVIEGDPELQLAVRHAIYQLMASVADQGEAAVGARGLTGGAYRGHVFWDSDVYVLPFLAATHPPAARAMLEYRVRRLPAALRAARAEGREGARFPWESARSGRDVTPGAVRDQRGESVPVLTGRLEEHIVADVAWATACYIDWSADHHFAAVEGRELLVQTARWWASRIEAGGHIRGVIGPDEYHERVDDNAFTNVMARWNLRRAAEIGVGRVDELERKRWLELAETIVDGYDAATGIYEQFAGFNALEPLLIAQIAAERPVAADILLGPDRTRGAQVVKQADVLMLHYLVPDEVVAGSLEPNLDFYEPRTAHGSTLSPGVHAALLARAGRLEHALETLRLTARIDLDDTGHMTAGGIHLAAMGSVWRALAFGFAGLRPAGDALAIDPVFPPVWEALELRIRFRGSGVRLRVREDAFEARADPPVHAMVPGGRRVELNASSQTFELFPSHARRTR